VKSSFPWWSKALIVVLIGTLVLAVGITSYLIIKAKHSGEPIAAFISPIESKALTTPGTIITLTVVGESEKGITSIGLYQNDELIAQRKADDETIKRLHAIFPWQETELGVHHLTAIAIDQNGQPSEPASLLVAVAAIPPEDINFFSDEGFKDVPSADAESESTSGGEGGSDAGGEGDNTQPGDAPGDGMAVFIPNGGVLQDEVEEAFEEQIDDGLQHIDLEDAQFPFELAGQPVDEPPSLLGLMSTVNREGFAATVHLSTDAVDDLGLERIALTVTNIDSLDSQSPDHFCLGELTCSLEHSMTLSTGQWLVTALAFDTSGQASQEQSLIVEVGAPIGNLPPALLEGVLASNWLSNLGELMAPGPVFSQQGMELDNLLGQILGGQDVGFEEQGEDEEVDGRGGGAGSGEGFSPDRCLSLWGESTDAGIELNLNIHCNIQAVDGSVLHFNGSANDMSNDLPRTDFVEGFNRQQQRISAGEVLNSIDSPTACGTSYNYMVYLEQGIVSQAGGFDADLERGNIVGPAYTTVSKPPCPENSIGNIDLQAELAPEGILVTVDLPPTGPWLDELTEGSYRLRINGFDNDHQHHHLRHYIDVNNPTSLAGFHFEFLDEDAICDVPHTYTFTINKLGELDVIAQKTIDAPIRPCNSASLIEVELDINTGITGEGVWQTIAFEIPPGASWLPDGQPTLKLFKKPVRGYPSQEYEIIATYPINDRVREVGIPNGFVNADLQPDECSDSFIYYLVLQGGFGTQFGTAYEAQAYACPPSTPILEQLHATSACRDSIGCIEVYWTPGNLIGYKEQIPIDHFRVYRTTRGIENYYEVQPGQNIYVDDHTGRNQTYSYYIRAVGTDGISFSMPSARFNIHIPPGREAMDWDFYSFDYFEGR